MKQHHEYENIKFLQCFIRGFADIKAHCDNTCDYDILDKILDIEDAIYNSKLSKRQLRVVELYIGGFYGREIAEIMGDITRQGVEASLKDACVIISKYLTSDPNSRSTVRKKYRKLKGNK